MIFKIIRLAELIQNTKKKILEPNLRPLTCRSTLLDSVFASAFFCLHVSPLLLLHHITRLEQEMMLSNIMIRLKCDIDVQTTPLLIFLDSIITTNHYLLLLLLTRLLFSLFLVFFLVRLFIMYFI